MNNPLPLPDTVTVESRPPLENEPLHKKLARLTKEHAKVTESLRVLREDWKQTNINIWNNSAKTALPPVPRACEARASREWWTIRPEAQTKLVAISA